MGLTFQQKMVAATSLLSVWPNVAEAETGPRVTIGAKMDNHTKPGQSDARGDEKYATISVRDNKSMVYAVETGIFTPQFDKKRESRDTGYITATIGHETHNLGVYATAGLANGAILDGWQNFVAASHGGHARTSEASSSARIVFGASARVDQDATIVEFENVKFDLDVPVFAQARTDKVAFGGGVFVSMNVGTNSDFRPNLPGFPIDNQQSAVSVYGGVTATTRIYDLETDKLGTKPIKFSAVAGVSVRKGALSLSAEYQKDLTQEIRGSNMPAPIGRTMITAGLNF